MTFARRDYRLSLVAFAAVLFVDFAAGFRLVASAAIGRDLGAWLIGGGCVADVWGRVRPNADVWPAPGAVLLEVAAIWLALRQTSFTSYVLVYAGFCVASGGWTGVATAIGLRLVPAAHRGLGTAHYVFVTTLFGPGLGSLPVGLGSDALGSVAAARRSDCFTRMVCAGKLRESVLLSCARWC